MVERSPVYSLFLRYAGAGDEPLVHRGDPGGATAFVVTQCARAKFHG